MGERKTYLDRLYIATPCSADWESMEGDDRVRFCHLCNLNVYDLSMMTKGQAEALIMQTEGRLCTKFYRRADGSILTQDCPVGFRALRRRVSHYAGAVLSAFLSFVTVGAVRLPVYAMSSTQSCKHELRVKRSKLKSKDGQVVLAGTVYDVNEAVIVGAKVTLVNEQTEESQSVETSEEGAFRFTSVEPGTYTLVAESRGFQIFRKKNIQVRRGENLDLCITLHVGSLGGAAFLPERQKVVKSA